MLDDNPFTVDATLIAELIVFALVIVVVARYLLPPLRAAMTERQARIDAALADVAAARDLRAEAIVERDRMLAEARSDGAHILATYQAMAKTVEAEARRKAAGTPQPVVAEPSRSGAR